MTNDLYWIALQSVMGYANNRSIEVFNKFGDITDVFNADEKTVNDAKIMTPAEKQRLREYDFDSARRVIEKCERENIKIITPEDEQYPTRLLRIKNPPCVLYVQGDLPDVDEEVCIATVGTRSCTKTGLIVGSVLSYRLAQAGAVIVSGGALGIDSACSRGAVEARQKSVIVLGCGLSYPYLLKNRRIRDDVAANGAVITEYQPDCAPSAVTFPQRNRIMSGLSNGVVLIEAPEKSGALITVNYSLEQGKDVYVLPGDITNKNYMGNNKLLQDGANAVYTPRDVLNEYIAEYPHKLNLRNASTPLAEDRMFINLYNKNRNVPENKYVKENKPSRKSNDKVIQRRVKYSGVSGGESYENAAKIAAEPPLNYGESNFTLPPLKFEADEIIMKIYNCFTNKPQSVDILIEKSGLSASNVLYALNELEMNGAVDSLAGGMYKIAD